MSSTSNQPEKTNHRARWTAELDEKLLQMISSGKSTAECALHLGRSEMAIELRKLRHTQELIGKGMTIEDASRRIQLSPLMVEQHLQPAEEDSDDYLEKASATRHIEEDNNYKDGKIYDLVFEGNVIYRGSTIQTLENRLKGHRSSSSHGRLSDYIKKVGPQNVDIRLVELYPCKNKGELLTRERYLIREEKKNNNLLNIQYRYVETETFTKILSSK
jgi:hypothetical protein